MKICYDIQSVEDSHDLGVLRCEMEFDNQMHLIPKKNSPPEWAKMSRFTCDHCPIADRRYCPAALAIAPFHEMFRGRFSHENVRVTVSTPQRVWNLEGSLQQILGSMVGLLLAGSGCPHLDFFRPMAKMHLPMSTPEETFLRAASFHLLGQWVRQRKGLNAHWNLDGMNQRYQDVQKVNRHLLQRLQEGVQTGDASLNAVAFLDVFAQYGGEASLAESQIQDLESLFDAWLES